ncbi:MAG: hypothetical protein K0R12_1202 [Gammaproteobacteria bacterium]|jgi:hypothetical protein|nr:hypothetical protein [Gammaproteobacteria bacterium]
MKREEFFAAFLFMFAGVSLSLVVGVFSAITHTMYWANVGFCVSLGLVVTGIVWSLISWIRNQINS